MFEYEKNQHSDERLASQYVNIIFVVGRDTCQTLAKAIQSNTQGDISFPVNDDVSLEISLAILGTSLALLNGHSQVMTDDRGKRVESLCKKSIKQDYDLSVDAADKLNAVLDIYQNEFEKSMANNHNPFGDISGVMICRCLGSRTSEFCAPGTEALSPFLHQIVGDTMTMTIIETMTFWKGK